MERKVGELFKYKGVTLTTIENNSCEGCFFNDENICIRENRPLLCSSRFRKDNKSVIFKKMETRTIKLTLEKAKEFYKKGGEFKDLALSAYTEEELQEEILPNTWDEFCSKYGVQNEYYISLDSIIKQAPLNNFRLTCRDRNLLPDKQAAEAHLALMQLHQLRDCYRQGWKPNWPDKSPRWFICKNGDRTVVMTDFYYNTFLSFKSEETATLFLNNFRDLIEKAGDLI